jgi:hypothetical protein
MRQLDGVHGSLMRTAGRWTLLAAVVLAGRAQLPAGEDEPLLGLGARQFREGDFETAVFTLDRAVRRLTTQPDRRPELCRAYLFFGAAYVGLENEDAAKGKFREALRQCPELRPSAQEFSPRVMQLFESQVLVVTATNKKKSARKWLIIGGAGAAAAVGVAVATSGGEVPNRPPTVSIAGIPSETPIAGVTRLELRAAGTDPDGDPLSFTWDLGDGTAATGETVSHVYQSAGSFRVLLTANDGRNPAVQSSQTITVRDLNARWTGWVHGVSSTWQMTQAGTNLSAQAVAGNFGMPAQMRGTLASPRSITVSIEHYNDTNRSSDWFDNCTGTVNATVTTFQVSCPPSRYFTSTARVIDFTRGN